MMKRILTIVFLLSTCISYAQFKHPDYIVVHKEYYTKYDDILNGTIVYTSFEKRTDGWYVQYATAEEYKNKKNFKFWDVKTNKWLVLNFNKTTAKYQPINEYRIPYMYRVSPMYGYNGWYKDVITSLGKRDNLSDTLLYALSKAYFVHFTSSFGNQYGDFLKEDLLSSGTFPNTFGADQLIEVKHRFSKVNETTKRMMKQNPTFETFIGSLSIQYSNDVMDAYMRMYLYQNPEEAGKYMEPNLYDPYVIDFAKYLLSSCAKNAILFTNGDNDTYPLWYVQYGLGFRTDVSVINASLLTYPDYAVMVRKMGMINFSTPDKTILNEGSEYALILDKDKKMNFANLKKFMNQDFGKDIKSIDGGIFMFNINNKDYEVSSASYIYRGDLLIMDIIYSNLGKRPFCFTSVDKFKSLVPEEKFHYTPIKTAGFDGKDHANNLLAIWDKDFTLSDYTNVKDHISKQHNRLVNSMVYDISLKCLFLIDDGKKQEAEAIAKKVNERLSSPNIKRNMMWMYLATVFGKVGDAKTAGIIMDQAIKTETEEVKNDKNKDNSRVDNLNRSKQSVIDGTFTF